ncbi:Alpha/beta hydrolase family protein [Candidatus Methylomirabilis lanthanidiphila]|uniref:Alpha/beta hydrolase family protein n=1 Tax=Candidatus Methylomirabilis lanthanidiphila TaxID=2211376 RepID=A0A564ZK64_9BACT|nr:Alpha/beta hydrolase family protein [Candidatus Methylomirabilis lanthanidiphila]
MFLVLLLTLFLTGGCVEALENRFIFFPDKRIEATPRDRGLAYEEIYFTTSDGIRLHGWWIPGTGSSLTILWFHGNGGNISHRLDNITLRHDLLGTNIFIFDYRGYGRSEGEASEEGTYHDGDAAIGYLRGRRDVDPTKIVFLGESLGSAVAVEMATRHDCVALILESPFLSIAEMAKASFPLLPIGSLLQTKYDTLAKIGRIRAPLLIVHGENDEIVPFRHGRRLFEAASEPKEFYGIPRARHNDLYLIGGPAYLETLNRFFAKAIEAAASP